LTGKINLSQISFCEEPSNGQTSFFVFLFSFSCAASTAVEGESWRPHPRRHRFRSSHNQVLLEPGKVIILCIFVLAFSPHAHTHPHGKKTKRVNTRALRFGTRGVSRGSPFRGGDHLLPHWSGRRGVDITLIDRHPFGPLLT